MIGQATAGLQAAPRAWVQRWWGIPDVHTRQKWPALWRELATLPSRGVRVLDAGCGSGLWGLEIARRRPHWTVTGIDRSSAAIREAERSRARLGVDNAAFGEADFLSFEPEQKFDVVLSVASAHYLVAGGRGAELFARFSAWLKPGGWLVLLGPRAAEENPYSRRLPKPDSQPVFYRGQLTDLAEENGLAIHKLRPLGSRLSATAKQLTLVVRDSSSLLKVLVYPWAYLLSALDRFPAISSRDRSLFWILVAERSS